MDRGRIGGTAAEKLRAAAGKYKYAIAVILFGALLMLLPTGSGRETRVVETSAAETRTGVQSEMEAALAAFDGAGRLRLVLSMEPGTQRCMGALVVCEGGGSAAVRLELTRALSALTGLSSEKIAIVKGKP